MKFSLIIIITCFIFCLASATCWAGVPLSDSQMAQISCGEYCGSNACSATFCQVDNENGGDCFPIVGCGCDTEITGDCSSGTPGNILGSDDGYQEQNPAGVITCSGEYRRRTFSSLCFPDAGFICIGLCWENSDEEQGCGDYIPLQSCT